MLPCFRRNNSYLTNFSQMRWTVDGSGVLTDPDNYFNKSAAEILNDIFDDKSIFHCENLFLRCVST